MYGDRRERQPIKVVDLKAKLTGTWNNRNVAQQPKDLWAEEGSVPNIEKLVEKSL